jgi:putative membrane protein
MRLVVCVDRDDDLGRKAGLRGPVLGRAAVLDAVVKLGTVDPEDSDTNAMLAAVSVYDELKDDREEAEVVVLTGDGRVGTISDRKVASQFDEVLQKVRVDAVHLISDGAEDEYLYPLIASRKRVDSVRRVYVRQSASLQGTYMTLTRALKDQKLRAKVLLPAAAFCFFLSFLAVFNLWALGFIAFTLFFGTYVVVWTFNIDTWVIDQVQNFGHDVRRGSLAVFFGVVAFALAVLGILLGNQAGGSPSAPVPDRLFLFFKVALVWWVLAAAAWEGGRVGRTVLARGRVPSSFWVTLVSISAFAVEGYSLLYLAGSLLVQDLVAQQDLYLGLMGVLLGIGMGILAGSLHQYLRTVVRLREVTG